MDQQEAPRNRPGRWLGVAAAARLLDVDQHAVRAVAEAGGARRRQLPGRRAEWSRDDLERLARESIVEPAAAG